jgi:hypothetical protein
MSMQLNTNKAIYGLMKNRFLFSFWLKTFDSNFFPFLAYPPPPPGKVGSCTFKSSLAESMSMQSPRAGCAKVE